MWLWLKLLCPFHGNLFQLTPSTCDRKRKKDKHGRSKAIEENWCCRPAACNETCCKCLAAWLCVGGTFLLLVVTLSTLLFLTFVPLFYFFLSNHSLSHIYNICKHWSAATVDIFLRQLHKQIGDNTHLWRGSSTIGKVAWVQFIVKRALPLCCSPSSDHPFTHTFNYLPHFDGLCLEEHFGMLWSGSSLNIAKCQIFYTEKTLKSASLKMPHFTPALKIRV